MIPPYRNSNGVPLEVKGWIYIIIVISTIAAGTVYYYLAFGYRQTTAFNVVEPAKSIVRWARAVPKLRESDTHEPQYGVRRRVDIYYESEVSLPFSDKTAKYQQQFTETKLYLLAFRRVTDRASSKLSSDTSVGSSYGEMTSASCILYLSTI